MIVKFKRLVENAVIPKFARIGDAGMDLVATSFSIDEFGNHVFGTGIAGELPENCVGLLFPRSSVTKYGLIMANCVGVWDSGYRGEVFIKFKKLVNENANKIGSQEIYKIGDRVAQVVFLELPKIEILEVGNLGESGRGSGGFGSTGQ